MYIADHARDRQLSLLHKIHGLRSPGITTGRSRRTFAPSDAFNKELNHPREAMCREPEIVVNFGSSLLPRIPILSWLSCFGECRPRIFSLVLRRIIYSIFTVVTWQNVTTPGMIGITIYLLVTKGDPLRKSETQ